MLSKDFIQLSLSSIVANRMRSGLTAIEDFAGEDGAPLVVSARQRLAEQAASWMPALSSCVTRLLHSSDSFLKT